MEKRKPVPRKKITRTQAHYLEHFKQLAIELGREPSVREVGASVARGPMTTHCVLRKLEAAGYLKRGDLGRFRLVGKP